MTDYIKRDDAIKAFMKTDRTDVSITFKRMFAISVFEDILSADVAPIRHGHWIEEPYRDDIFTHRCSVCMKVGVMTTSRAHWNYCPNCGAKMDGESDD